MKKVLLTSIVTIALCLCLIAGSTFALFTDTKTTSIVVSSGKVEMVAAPAVNRVESLVPDPEGDIVDDRGGRYSYSYTILNQKMWGNVKIICVYVYACACVCVCMCMCVHVRVWCLCGGRGMCIISSPTRGSWLRPHQANTHGLELPSRIGTLHNHISKLQVTEVNV